MAYWFRGKWGGALAFVAIAALVIGGLGWVTANALRLEQEQLAAAVRDELNAAVRDALWRLDSRIWPVLAKEDSRPYNDYSAFYSPSIALRNDSTLWSPGTVVLPSPLLNADLPDWMLLHFRTGEQVDWGSPQVLSDRLEKQLEKPEVNSTLANVTPARKKLLKDLAGQLDGNALLNKVQERGGDPRQTETALVPANPTSESSKEPLPQTSAQPGQPLAQPQATLPNPQKKTNAAPMQSLNVQQQQGSQENLSQNDFENRYNVKSVTQRAVQSRAQIDDLRVAIGNAVRNGENWFTKNPIKPAPSEPTLVNLSPMAPVWLGEPGKERLIVARLVQIGQRQVCQGILLDWQRLQEILAEEVGALFPHARFEPVRDLVPPHPERTMTALPIQLDPGEPVATRAASGPEWTPLRAGLTMAWAAALLALLAVGLGGWSLIDLSQRRIRFVSAVTHELRTPLTTLRLYLDMLTGGIVKDERQKAEYLQTLHAETDRLNRLVGNVLDFSRLENQRPRLELTSVAVAELLEQVRSNWAGRCESCAKELLIENALPAETRVVTDGKLVQQILGNLIDNACKYTHEADDRRLWLRARSAGKRIIFEVEDRGPGVAPRERRAIFRAFRRGDGSDTTGGVGLGLALASRWAALLGGRLDVVSGSQGVGACFRLEMPS